MADRIFLLKKVRLRRSAIPLRRPNRKSGGFGAFRVRCRRRAFGSAAAAALSFLGILAILGSSFSVIEIYR
jgi:hypothetical protein